MKTMKKTPKIFVTDYESYNNGTQFEFGHWVDLTEYSNIDSLTEYLDSHFERSGIEDPEIMLTDFEDFPKRFYSESFDSSLMIDLFEFLELLKGCHNEDALTAYVEAGYDANDFYEAYTGEYNSDAEFAEDIAGQLDLIDPKAGWPQNCIDWDYAARELMYDYFETDGYYFRSL